MLRGTKTNPMDAKGRVSLPANHRKGLPDELVIVRSPRPHKGEVDFPHLRIYAENSYDAWTQEIIDAKMLTADDPRLRHLKFEMLNDAEDISVDLSGRVTVVKDLRTHGQLAKSVTFVGVDDHVELWDPEVLEQYRAYLLEHEPISIYKSAE